MKVLLQKLCAILKMKKEILIIIILLSTIILVSFGIFYKINYIAFSEINGKVIDTEGNPIPNANVRVTYIGKGNIITGEYNVPQNLPSKIEEAITDKNGEFKFNSFDVGFHPFITSGKVIKVYKENYCGSTSISPGTPYKTINSDCVERLQRPLEEMDKYENFYSWTASEAYFTPKDSSIVIKLVKLDDKLLKLYQYKHQVSITKT